MVNKILVLLTTFTLKATFPHSHTELYSVTCNRLHRAFSLTHTHTRMNAFKAAWVSVLKSLFFIAKVGITQACLHRTVRGAE